jgi:hypothetical protein
MEDAMDEDVTHLEARIRALEKSRDRWARGALVGAIVAVSAGLIALGPALSGRAVEADQVGAGEHGALTLDQLARRLSVLEANQRALAAAITIASRGHFPSLAPDRQGFYDAANALPAQASALIDWQAREERQRTIPQP